MNCVETLINEGVTVWIDAGPAAVLATFVKRIILPSELSKHRIVQTCKEKDSDVETLVHACLELEQSGIPVNWSKLYGCVENEDAFLVEFPVLQKQFIRNDEFEILEGHRLNGRIIVAGAYQMFKMDQLIKSKALGFELVLRNVKFVKPWYIEDSKEFEVRWNSNMTIEVVVNTVVVCSARVEAKEGNINVEKIGEDEKTFDVHEFYETLYRNGLQYESGFRRIDTAKRSNLRCFSQLKASPFAWPLIDAAMHSITASVIIRRPDSYFLPVAMGTVRLAPECSFNCSNLHAQTVITSETDKFIQINVILFSRDNIICEVRNMTIVVLKLVPAVTPTPTPNLTELTDAAKGNMSDIQIVGFDITLPFNQMSSNSENWEFLKLNKIKQPLHIRHAKNQNVRVSLLDADARFWDPEYFGIRPSEAQFLDPQQRLLLNSVAKLLDSTTFSSLPSNTGVFIGCSTYEFSHVVYAHGHKDPRAEWGGGTSNSALAGRIAHWLKLKGPVSTVDTACSSSFYALSLACDAIKSGKCDYAIVGAVNLVLHEMTTDVLQNAQMTVHDFCKAFDVDANGYKRSEAVCSILLSKSHKSRSIASIANWATGHNGNSSSLFTPNGKSQLEVMQRATENVHCISGVEMHCTGTKLGDPIEANAVSKLIVSDCAINSIKSNVGHCEGASGLVSLCSLLMALQSEYKPAQLHLKCPTEVIRGSHMHCKFVGEELSLEENSIFVVNNFGFTGSNCSVVVKPNRKEKEPFMSDEARQIFYPMLLSAHTKESLRQYIEDFQDFVRLSDCPLEEIQLCLLKKKVNIHRHFIIFNYKRKIVVDKDNENMPLHEDRLDDLLRQCRIFVKDGNVLMKKKLSQRRRELPPIVFMKNLHWKLDSFHDQIDGPVDSSLRDIFYEKVFVELPMTRRPKLENVVSFGEFGSFRRIAAEQVPEFTDGIIIFHPTDSDVSSFLQLTKLWGLVNPTRNVMVTVCCFNNLTTYSEWTGTLRSLAAEKLIPYKFVSIERFEDFDYDCNTQDAFECVFNVNGKRMVERLIRTAPTWKERAPLNDVLISGGTGGIGDAIIKKLQIRKPTVITRKATRNTETEGSRYFTSDVRTFQSSETFKNVFHLAGIVNNVSHTKVNSGHVTDLVDVKLQGAKNLFNCMSRLGRFFFSSSIASILGSFGQSNYTFANGLVTSFLEKSDAKSEIIHWGPWKEVGMLSRSECSKINEQIEASGWYPLSTQDALSVFSTENFNSKRQIGVFDGDWNTIISRQPHLQLFLSEIVQLEVTKPAKKSRSDFSSIFTEIVGISDMSSKTNVPFMDLGIDSLCMENLRHNLNVDIGLELTVSELFENATYDKLKSHVEKLVSKRKTAPLPTQVPERMEIKDDNRVAVIGWSAEFSGAENIREFWQNLLDGVVSTETEKALLKNQFGFDNKFFNITDEDAKMLDPQVRRFIQHAYLALENSGYITQRSSLKCAVFAGAEPSNYGNSQEQDDAMKKLFVMNMNNYLATYASYCLDLKGEAVSVYSACSTTLVAVANAVKSLQSNSIDIALVGAASITDEELDGREDSKRTIFAKSGICKPFDKYSEGIVRGSGVGCLVLKKYSNAVADGDNVHFIIKDFGMNNDGNSRASFMAPNPAGQLACMTDVLGRLSKEDKNRIKYVECHATGTTLGDTIEMNSLRDAYFFKSKLQIGSCKANIGHAYAASGLAALIKCAKILQTEKIPPQINFSEFRNGFEGFFDVSKTTKTIDRSSLIALDSFGIGGTNVHMIIELPPEIKKNSVHDDNYVVLPISANSEISLNKVQETVRNYLHADPQEHLVTIGTTLLRNRERMVLRTFLVANKIGKTLETRIGTRKMIDRKNPKIALFFAPQGLQYSNILPKDFAENDVFKTTMDQLCQIANRFGLTDMKTALYPPNGQNGQIDRTRYVQVALFIQCFAIYKSLKRVLKPELLIGHSVGEYTAAAVSEVFDVEDVVRLLLERSKLIEKTERARMLMIWDYRKPLPAGIEVSAVVDSRTRCVVGPVRLIDSFEDVLKQNGTKYRNIKTAHGFHSSLLSPIARDFQRLIQGISTRSSKIPIISSITGEVINRFDANYCKNHLLQPVNLDSVVNRLIECGIDIVVEIGPTGVLSNLLAQRDSNITVIATCGSKKNPETSLANCIGQLWNHGVDIREIMKYSQIDGNVPGYQFDEKLFKKQSASSEIVSGINTDCHLNFNLFTDCWIEEQIVTTDHINHDFWVLDGLEFPPENHYVPVVVVIVRYTEEVHENFFKLEKFLKSSPRCDQIIFAAIHNHPNVHFILGLLRCYQLQTRIKLSYVENFDDLPISELLSKTQKSREQYTRITTNGVFRHDYLQISRSPNTESFHGVAIVFGANGFIGTQVCSLLEARNLVVYRVSRSSPHFCDITNQEDVENFFEDLEARQLSLVVNCAGQETSPKINKTYGEKSSVLSVKTYANKYILSCLERRRIHVGKYVALSSLSSVIPMFGNEDYASGNCYVEALTRKKYSSVRRILSLSLPPIQESRMYEDSSSTIKKMLQTIAMNRKELRNVLENALFTDMQGAVFVSPENPRLISEKSVKHHRTNENDNQLEFTAPTIQTDDVEHLISNIWMETLGSSLQIAPSSNFFSLGGDSLSALQVVWQVQKQFGKTVQVNDLFDHPTLQCFSDFIKVAHDQNTRESQIESIDYDAIGLTHSQTQMFMLRQIDVTSKYNVIFGITVKYRNSQFKWELLRCAILSLIAYQTSYRTVFDNLVKPVQKVCSLTESFYNLDNLCDFQEAVSHENNHQFEIAKSTPLRIRIAENTDKSQIHIVFNQHHILTDGWSMTVLADTISSLYDAYEANTGFPPKLHQTIANVVKKEERDVGNLSNLLDEAEDHFKGGYHTSIPFDSPALGNQDHKRFMRTVHPELWEKLVEVSKKRNTTVYTAALTVFSECVSSFSGQSDILIAYANSGRKADNSNLIGYFMNNVLFKVLLPSDKKTFEESLEAVSSSLEVSRKFSTVPFYKIVERNRCLNAISVYFNFRQKLDYPVVSVAGATCRVNHLSLNNAFDFSFTIDETPDGSMISIDYDAMKYSDPTIDLFSGMFLRKLNNLQENNKRKTPIVKLDYPLSLIRSELLLEWQKSSDNAIFKSSEVIVYSQFAMQIEKAAQLIQKQMLTRTATSLREDALIGLDSSLPPVAIIACSLLGVPYAPVDFTWPQQRRDYVKERISLMFKLEASIPAQKSRCFNCRTQFGGIYTIFTSGSTGVPKGVYMAEQSASSFVTSATKQCLFRRNLHVLDSVKQVFDVSVSNIFCSLFNSGVLISPESSTTITEELPKCQYAFLPAAVFNGLTIETVNRMRCIETLTVGGETVSDETLEVVFKKLPNLKVIQIYGPTETCVWSLTNRCKPFEKKAGSCLGVPVGNEYYHIGNNFVRGELKIGGVSLARGYISCDSIGIPFAKVYSTGDIVDSRSGKVQYIGRLDNQVKWKGIRIDLAELQNEYVACLPISQIILLLSNQMLIAFLVQKVQELNHAELLQKLKGCAHLPDHIVQVDKLPLNSSGKVDKKVLLQAFEQVRKSYKREMVTMQNSLEEKVRDSDCDIANNTLFRSAMLCRKQLDRRQSSRTSSQMSVGIRCLQFN